MILITQPRVGTIGTLHSEVLALHFAAKELGWEVYSTETSWRLPDELIASGKQGVPYGSQTFCEVIAQQMGWTLHQNSFDWLAKLPIEYTKRKVDFMTLGEAKLLQETKFIKPADDKVFMAKVYAPGELIVSDVVPNDTPTLVSDVVRWDLEYRCFVENNRVLTWSNYIFHEHVADPKYWNVIDSNDEALPYEFVQDLLFDLEDVETVASVIDVGRIPGKGLAIIETNPAWASGIYGCDPMRMLKVIKSAVSY
jgi:hypothetical protein